MVKVVLQAGLLVAYIKLCSYIGADWAALAFVTGAVGALSLYLWQPQSTALAVVTQPASQPQQASVMARPAQPAQNQPTRTEMIKIDTSTWTGEQMYYELERKTINGCLAPFGFLDRGAILIRARAVVFPLIYSRRRKDGKAVKIKVQSIEEHVPSIKVDINMLRAQYGHLAANVVVSLDPFALVVSAIHEAPVPWSARPNDLEPLQAALGLTVATAEEAPVIWDISDAEDEYYAMLAAGVPKAGKTTLINSILIQLCQRMSPEALQLHIVENPKGDFAALADLPHVAHYVPWGDVISVLTYVRDELCQGKPDPARPYHVVVIDEIQRYAIDPVYRDKFLDLLTQILTIGRALRVRLLLATPRPSAEMFSNNVLENIPVRVAGKLGAAGSRIVIRSDNAERLTAKGAFIQYKDGTETLFYAYLLTDEEKAQAITAISEKYGGRALLAEPASYTVDQEIRHNGETILPNVLAYVQANYDPKTGDLIYGAKGPAYNQFYSVQDMRSGNAEAARKNLRTTIDYYKSKQENKQNGEL